MTARLETLITRALLDMLSDAIVARLRLRRRSALVLVSGTELGLRRRWDRWRGFAPPDGGWRYGAARMRRG